MTNILKTVFALGLILALLSRTSQAENKIYPEMIKKATTYPGPKTEKKLTDLLRSDYYNYLSDYYLNKEKAGFMALERFDLAFTRAVGDIRILSEIKDTSQRQKMALEAFNNWTAAFKRAQISNMPK